MKKMYLAGLVALGLSCPAHASLVVSGTGTMAGVTGNYQLIYDADLDITWLDYSAPRDTWQNQVNWASNLSVNVGGQNITGWRLPTTVDNRGNGSDTYNGSSSLGFNNPNTSEMSYLFYTELGNRGVFDTNGYTFIDGLGHGLNNTGVFKNFLSSSYWSGTSCATYPSTAWFLFMNSGYQTHWGKANNFYALAVLPGQIQAVPEPASLLLIGSGLAGLMSLKRRKE